MAIVLLSNVYFDHHSSRRCTHTSTLPRIIQHAPQIEGAFVITSTAVVLLTTPGQSEALSRRQYPADPDSGCVVGAWCTGVGVDAVLEQRPCFHGWHIAFWTTGTQLSGRTPRQRYAPLWCVGSLSDWSHWWRHHGARMSGARGRRPGVANASVESSTYG